MLARFVLPRCAAVVALMVPLAASADPSAEAQDYMKVAFTACQQAITYNKIDVDLFTKWMENRAKSVKADPSIRTWTGKLYGEVVKTRFEQCEALFKKALDDAEHADATAEAKAEAAKHDPAVVGPIAEGVLGRCFEVDKDAGTSRWGYEKDMLADRRKRLHKDNPDAEGVKTLKAYGSVAAGATWAEVFRACDDALDKGLARAKAIEAKQHAAEQEAQRQARERSAAAERKFQAQLKGDRLAIFKRRNTTIPTEGDLTSRTWVYVFAVGTGSCRLTYTFRGNTTIGVTKEGICSEIQP
jgi:hypothetical protein